MPSESEQAALEQFAFPCDVWVFEQMMLERQLLGRTGRHLNAGTSMRLGDLMLMYYDHDYKLAVKLHEGDKEFYILAEEASPELFELCRAWKEKRDSVEKPDQGQTLKDLEEVRDSAVAEIRKFGRAPLKAV